MNKTKTDTTKRKHLQLLSQTANIDTALNNAEAPEATTKEIEAGADVSILDKMVKGFKDVSKMAKSYEDEGTTYLEVENILNNPFPGNFQDSKTKVNNNPKETKEKADKDNSSQEESELTMNENYKSIDNKLDSLVNSVSSLANNQRELKDELNEIKYSNKAEVSIIKNEIDVLKRNDENHFKILTLIIALVGLLLGGLYFSINTSINSSRNETNTKLDMLNQKLDSQKEVNSLQIEKNVSQEFLKQKNRFK